MFASLRKLPIKVFWF